jgi:hypothetical protein
MTTTPKIHLLPNVIDPADESGAAAEERAARPKFEFFEGDELTSKPTPIKGHRKTVRA